MSSMARGITLGALALVVGAAVAGAQERKYQDDVWYIGAQGGLTAFRTPAQTRGGIPSVGGSLLIKAKRGGLLLKVDEGIGDNEVTAYSYTNPAGDAVTTTATFNDLRSYQAILMAFPANWNIDPYFGAGVGLQSVVNPSPAGPFATQADLDAATNAADELGTHSFGTFLAGVRIRTNRFVVFGQWQIQSSPSAGKLLAGPIHRFEAGVHIGLGSRKELR